METSFHLSLPFTSIFGTKKFYIDIIGANLGRYANNWVDIDLFGHQVTFTQVVKFDFIKTIGCLVVAILHNGKL